MTEEEQKWIDEFFSENGGGVCDVVMVTDKPRFTEPERTGYGFKNNMYGNVSRLHFLPNQACHGFTEHYGEHRHVVGIYSSVRGYGPRKNIAHKWCQFITGPESPWRSLPKFEDATYGVTKRDEPSYVYVPVTPDTPSQLLVNFLIATRAVWEKYDGKLMVWDVLKDKGFTDLEAMFFAWHQNCESTYTKASNPDDWRLRQEYGSMHMFIDTFSNPTCFKKLLHSTPTLNNNRYNERPCYRPCNVIWRRDRGGIYKCLADLQKQNEYHGVFIKAFTARFGKTNKFPHGGFPKLGEFADQLLKAKEELYK